MDQGEGTNQTPHWVTYFSNLGFSNVQCSKSNPGGKVFRAPEGAIGVVIKASTKNVVYTDRDLAGDLPAFENKDISHVIVCYGDKTPPTEEPTPTPSESESEQPTPKPTPSASESESEQPTPAPTPTESKPAVEKPVPVKPAPQKPSAPAKQAPQQAVKTVVDRPVPERVHTDGGQRVGDTSALAGTFGAAALLTLGAAAVAGQALRRRNN